VKSVTGARHTAFIGRLIVAVVCTLGWLLAAGPSAVAAQPLAPEASGLVTLSLHDADAKSVFTLLAELAGLNLVVDPAVQMPVTISLREVPVREAIALSAKAARASAVITGDLLVVSLSIGRHSSPMLVLYRLCGTKAVFDPRDLCT
jgi:type II secretory pathway component GspD/PulD (secretin)